MKINRKPHLTHYTDSQETLIKILANGFGYIPNKKFLINDLLPNCSKFNVREPQNFGMISFTSLSPLCSQNHRRRFGDFGIVMTKNWVLKNNAVPVTYLKNTGFKFKQFQKLFKDALEDLQNKIKYPEDTAWNEAYYNKNVSASIIGSLGWHNALEIYEFLEPYNNKNQKEWRIVNPLPLYGFSADRSENIRNIDPPLNWAQHTHVLKFNKNDIEKILCPKNKLSSLIQELPNHYKNKEIETYHL